MVLLDGPGDWLNGRKTDYHSVSRRFDPSHCLFLKTKYIIYLSQKIKQSDLCLMNKHNILAIREDCFYILTHFNIKGMPCDAYAFAMLSQALAFPNRIQMGFEPARYRGNLGRTDGQLYDDS